jgi:hypothetical protein
MQGWVPNTQAPQPDSEHDFVRPAGDATAKNSSGAQAPPTAERQAIKLVEFKSPEIARVAILGIRSGRLCFDCARAQTTEKSHEGGLAKVERPRLRERGSVQPHCRARQAPARLRMPWCRRQGCHTLWGILPESALRLSKSLRGMVVQFVQAREVGANSAGGPVPRRASACGDARRHSNREWTGRAPETNPNAQRETPCRPGKAAGAGPGAAVRAAARVGLPRRSSAPRGGR